MSDPSDVIPASTLVKQGAPVGLCLFIFIVCIAICCYRRCKNVDEVEYRTDLLIPESPTPGEPTGEPSRIKLDLRRKTRREALQDVSEAVKKLSPGDRIRVITGRGGLYIHTS